MQSCHEVLSGWSSCGSYNYSKVNYGNAVRDKDKAVLLPLFVLMALLHDNPSTVATQSQPLSQPSQIQLGLVVSMGVA